MEIPVSSLGLDRNCSFPAEFDDLERQNKNIPVIVPDHRKFGEKRPTALYSGRTFGQPVRMTGNLQVFVGFDHANRALAFR
jgi:hypothetical protein